MFWSGWVKDCKGGGLGRGWAGGWWCGYRHRSAKGATSESRKPRTPPPFQSTPPRRERLRVLTGLRQARRYFNPRSREGSDDQRKYSLLEYSAISIHAPAKGATSARWFPWSSPSHFNPRSREGSDISQAQLLQDWRISIHAPAKGATVSVLARWVKTIISIHAPAKGATLRRWCTGGGCLFQSTLPRRERHCRPTTSTRDKLFQSTLP